MAFRLSWDWLYHGYGVDNFFIRTAEVGLTNAVGLAVEHKLYGTRGIVVYRMTMMESSKKMRISVHAKSRNDVHITTYHYFPSEKRHDL